MFQTTLTFLVSLAVICGICFWVRALFMDPTELVKACLFIGAGFVLSTLTGDAKFMVIPGILLFGTLLHSYFVHQPPEE